MKLQIENKNTKFQFVCDSKALDGSIVKAISALAISKDSNRVHFIAAYDGNLNVIAFTGDTYCCTKVECKSVSGVGLIGFDPDLLQGVIKNRGEMKFIFNGNYLTFSVTKGKYSGQVVTLPFEEEIVKLINDKHKGNKAISLSDEVLDLIREGITLTSIKDVFNTNELILSYVTIKNNKLKVIGFDNHHFSMYEASVKANDFRCALLPSYIQVLDKFKSSKIKVSISQEFILLESADLLVEFPALQTDDKNYTLVTDFLKDLPKPTIVCNVNSSRLSNVIDNMYSLYLANSFINLQCDKTKLSVSFDTSRGKCSEDLKIDYVEGKAISISVDPKLLKDILNISKAYDNSMSIIKDKLIVFKAVTKSKSKLTIASSLS